MDHFPALPPEKRIAAQLEPGDDETLNDELDYLFDTRASFSNPTIERTHPEYFDYSLQLAESVIGPDVTEYQIQVAYEAFCWALAVSVFVLPMNFRSEFSMNHTEHVSAQELRLLIEQTQDYLANNPSLGKLLTLHLDHITPDLRQAWLAELVAALTFMGIERGLEQTHVDESFEALQKAFSDNSED